MRTETYKPQPIAPIDGPSALPEATAEPKVVGTSTTFVAQPVDHHRDPLLDAIRAQ